MGFSALKKFRENSALTLSQLSAYISIHLPIILKNDNNNWVTKTHISWKDLIPFINLLKCFTFLDNARLDSCVFWGCQDQKPQILTEPILSDALLKEHLVFTFVPRPPNGKILGGLGKSFGIFRFWKIMVSFCFTLSVEKFISLAVVEQCSKFEYNGENQLEMRPI